MEFRLEEQVDTGSSKRNCQNRSFNKADHNLLKVDGRLRSQHDCGGFREENDLTHGDKTHKSAGFNREDFNLALDDQNRQEHRSRTA